MPAAEEGEEEVDAAADALVLMRARRVVLHRVARRGPLAVEGGAPAAGAAGPALAVGGGRASGEPGAAAFEAEVHRILAPDEETFNIDVAVDQGVRRSHSALPQVLRRSSPMSLVQPLTRALCSTESHLARQIPSAQTSLLQPRPHGASPLGDLAMTKLYRQGWNPGLPSPNPRMRFPEFFCDCEMLG